MLFRSQGLTSLNEDIEVPLVRVLARMEQVGVGVDVDVLTGAATMNVTFYDAFGNPCTVSQALMVGALEIPYGVGAAAATDVAQLDIRVTIDPEVVWAIDFAQATPVQLQEFSVD